MTTAVWSTRSNSRPAAGSNEIEFKTGGWEFEYTISAADGTILDYERDN